MSLSSVQLDRLLDAEASVAPLPLSLIGPSALTLSDFQSLGVSERPKRLVTFQTFNQSDEET